MSINEMDSKIKELREFAAWRTRAGRRKWRTIQDSIKATHMDAGGRGHHQWYRLKVTYKAVTSSPGCQRIEKGSPDLAAVHQEPPQPAGSVSHDERPS